MTSLNGNLSKSQCPYCGGVNGSHIWAGSGGCPGTRNLGGTIFQGYPTPLGVNPQDLQPVHVWPTQVVGQDGYEVAKIYQEARGRLLEELKAQVEVNRMLCRDLLDARLKLAEFKLKYKIVE